MGSLPRESVLGHEHGLRVWITAVLVRDHLVVVVVNEWPCGGGDRHLRSVERIRWRWPGRGQSLLRRWWWFGRELHVRDSWWATVVDARVDGSTRGLRVGVHINVAVQQLHNARDYVLYVRIGVLASAPVKRRRVHRNRSHLRCGHSSDLRGSRQKQSRIPLLEKRLRLMVALQQSFAEAHRVLLWPGMMAVAEVHRMIEAGRGLYGVGGIDEVVVSVVECDGRVSFLFPEVQFVFDRILRRRFI